MLVTVHLDKGFPMKYQINKVLSVAVLFACLAFSALTSAEHHPARAQDGDSPQSCKMGVYLTSLHDLDITAKTFAADMWIWSNCPTEELTPLQSMEFVNANQYEAKLDYSEVKNGIVWAQRKVNGVFRHNWDVHNYPFDRHTLIVEMEEAAYDTSSFVYEADSANSTYSPSIQLDGWKITDFKILSRQTEYTTTFGDPSLESGGSSLYTKLEVAISITRTELTSFLKLIGPVYIAFAVALLSLLLYLENASVLSAQIGLLAGSLFATVINLSIASTSLGASERLTLVDQIHILSLLYILIITGVAIQSQLALKKGQTADGIRDKNFRIFLILGETFIILNAVMIALAIRQG
jgi:hypothetical protein